MPTFGFKKNVTVMPQNQDKNDTYINYCCVHNQFD